MVTIYIHNIKLELGSDFSTHQADNTSMPSWWFVAIWDDNSAAHQEPRNSVGTQTQAKGHSRRKSAT